MESVDSVCVCVCGLSVDKFISLFLLFDESTHITAEDGKGLREEKCY